MVNDYSKHGAAEKLSANFRVREFSCKCGCGKTLVDDRLVAILQHIRDHFGVSVNITSGCRCAAHNAAVGGDPNSSHVQGMAADIVVKGIQPGEVAKYAESIGVQRIGRYDSFVHIGSGSERLFWVNKNSNRVDTFGGLPPFELTLNQLWRGCEGDHVKAVQRLLRGEGYSIAIDGSYGAKTANAVECFQEDCDLPATGVVDQATMARLLGLEVT